MEGQYKDLSLDIKDKIINATVFSIQRTDVKAGKANRKNINSF